MLKRAALICFGLLVAVVGLELLLQLGALVVRATGTSPPEGFVTGRVRVLCVGDSNTYGVWGPRDRTYPAQVERIWNELHETPKVEVLNLGYPGMNSSRLLREFPRMLRVLEPDHVVVMIGANDYWTEPVPVASSEEAPPEPGLVERYSRLYKLFTIWRAARDREREVDVIRDPDRKPQADLGVARIGDEEIELGFERSAEPQGDADRSIEANVRRMIALAEESGVGTLVALYPSRRGLYRLARPNLRRAARGTSADLLDLNPFFASRCPTTLPPLDEAWCADLLATDDHPLPSGNTIIAEAVVTALESRLLR